MKRGEIWTAAASADYASKPRPVVILQDDRFDATNSITICGLTASDAEAPLARPLVQPSQQNGLRQTSRLMVDKITTLPRARLRDRVGRLTDSDIDRLNQAIIVFLGLAAKA
jgi:mRNA interferase MazF